MDISPVTCIVSENYPPVNPRRRPRKSFRLRGASIVGENIIEVSKHSPGNLPELTQVWAQWCDNPSFHWTWFGHFTFRGFPHTETANKAFQKFTNIINSEIWGKKFYRNPVKRITWVRATEYQSRGSLHYHAIFGNIPASLDRFKFMDIWNEIAGFSQIFLYEPSRGAEYYLSKSAYAFKQGEIDVSESLKFHIEQEILR